MNQIINRAAGALNIVKNETRGLNESNKNRATGALNIVKKIRHEASMNQNKKRATGVLTM